MGCRNKSASKHRPLVFAVQKHDIHDDVLVLPDQRRHLNKLVAFRRAQLLPSKTYLLERLVRQRQAGKQAFSRFGKFPDINGLRALECAVFSLDKGQKFAAQGEVFAQYTGRFDGGQRVAGRAGDEWIDWLTCIA